MGSSGAAYMVFSDRLLPDFVSKNTPENPIILQILIQTIEKFLHSTDPQPSHE